MQQPELLIIRLGAMGDILHAVPAVSSLRRSLEGWRITWLVASKWAPLLEGNPALDRLILLDRKGLSDIGRAWQQLRGLKPELAIDFQGLAQSAILGRVAGAKRLVGFDRAVAREPLASAFYSMAVHVKGPHRIERNLQLASAVGAKDHIQETWIPQGSPEGELPDEPFVLASPFAGWESKQWPLTHYEDLGGKLLKQGWKLVLNVPPGTASKLDGIKCVHLHSSSLPGLIHATRRATAVLGVDSGPLHLAAALKKPGLALYGQTDPAQTGPYNSPIVVMRQPGVANTYKRGREIHSSMAAITPEEVCSVLLSSVKVNKTHLAASVRE